MFRCLVIVGLGGASTWLEWRRTKPALRVCEETVGECFTGDPSRERTAGDCGVCPPV